MQKSHEFEPDIEIWSKLTAAQSNININIAILSHKQHFSGVNCVLLWSLF